ncbi:MAG: glycosyltransferase [Planctomycetales bacterium]|nr:glycosyltransferase [Planctomycetales bacterium]
MRIKVCQIIPTLVQGGAEKQMSLLAAGLNRSKFDSQVVVLTHTGPNEEFLRSEHIPVHIVGKRLKLDPTAYWRLRRTVKQLKPDIVHTWLFAANCYGRQAAHSLGVPVIIAGERCVDPWKEWWHHALDRHFLKYTDKIVTNTSAIVDFYAQHGISCDKFHVIPNAAVIPQVEPISKTEFFNRLRLPPTKYLIGAIGRLWKQKGYKDLIWAAELVRVALRDVTLVIIGDGPDRELLQTYRDKSGAGDVVRFAGHRQDAQQLMTAFDLLWNGSLYEGQSNTMLEAMSLGIPVIASNIPGNRDLVVPDETGCLFDLGDVNTLARKTCQWLQDSELRERLGHNAKNRAQSSFSLAAMIASHEQLYETLLNRPNK